METSEGLITTPRRTVPGLGSQAAVLSVGLVVASLVSWIAGGMLLPVLVEIDREAWIMIGFALAGIFATAFHLLMLGVFLAARGLAARYGSRRWSVWWALVPTSAVTAVGLALVVVNGLGALESVPLLVALLGVLAVQTGAVALAARVRLPRSVSIVLGVLMAVLVLWYVLGWFGLGLL